MIRVGVIRGGSHEDFEPSVTTGSVVLSHMLEHPQLKSDYKPIDILVDQNNMWHMNGIPVPRENIYQLVDVLFNTLHSPYDYLLAREAFTTLNIKTPTHMLFEAYLPDIDGPEEIYPAKKAKEVFYKIPPPWRVFPLTKGSSMGIHVCKTLPELVRAFEVGMRERVSVVVEELINGIPTSVSVLNNFRNQPTYAFFPTENISSNQKREIEHLAKTIHNHLHLNHYSESQFIVTPKKGIYALGVKTSPSLHLDSPLHAHLESLGVSVPQFIDHIIKLSLEDK